MNKNDNNCGEKSLVVPTLRAVIKRYQQLAALQRLKTGSPSEVTVQNVLVGVRIIFKAMKLPLSSPVTALTRQRFDQGILKLDERKLSRVTIKSYINNVRGLFARWCLPYYEDEGWEIPPIKYPVFAALAPRYVRPSNELLARVKNWYRNLKGEYWFAATMMLEFAMRNGDVLRLTKDNFITKQVRNEDGSITTTHFLMYTPHKTSTSSGREVNWPIVDSIWNKIVEYGGIDKLEVTTETFSQINDELRALGFLGHKASYELRKICIDRYYHYRSIEDAVAISGDCLKTITWYYTDPTRENAQVFNVVDSL